MAVIGLSFERAAATLAGLEDRLSIAVSNSPTSTVVSGDPRALDQLIDGLERRDIFCRRVKVDVASHSPQMDPLRDDLLAALSELEPRAASIPICSTVLAEFTDGAGFDAGYWARNLRQPVLFSAAVRKLIASGHDTFIEVSPHALLASSVQEILQDAGADGLIVGSLRRDDDDVRAMGSALASLWVGGYAVDWNRVYPTGRCVALPTYCWQRERHWLDVAPAGAPIGAHGRRTGHPLLGARVQSPVPVFHVELAAATDRWLDAIRYDGLPHVPAALWLSMASAVAAERGGDEHVVERVEVTQAVAVPADRPLHFQTVLSAEAADRSAVDTYVLTDPQKTGPDAWRTCTSGQIRRPAQSAFAAALPLAEASGRCEEATAAAAFYGRLADAGLDVREDARAISALSEGADEKLAWLEIPASFRGSDSRLAKWLEGSTASDCDGFVRGASHRRIAREPRRGFTTMCGNLRTRWPRFPIRPRTLCQGRGFSSAATIGSHRHSRDPSRTAAELRSPFRPASNSAVPASDVSRSIRPVRRITRVC
jgi:acyl transferase domain-containing protein